MKTSIWFSWIILAVAIVALCVAIVRCEPIKADWVSIDIGVLAILATCLVGWQVYTLIDMRQYKKDLNDLRSEITKTKTDTQRALREVIAEYSIRDAGKLIGSFNPEKKNYEVIGVAYGLSVRALRDLTYSNQKEIGTALDLLRKCIFIARFYNAWDIIFSEEVARMVKEDYHLIAIGLIGGNTDYLSQIDEIKTWRLTKTMDEAIYNKLLAEFITN